MTNVSEVDQFLAAIVPRQRHADKELHEGNPGPRKNLWSHQDPVTVLGAVKSASGWPEVEGLFDWLASNFSNCVSYDLDVLTAGVSGDLGYLVGTEHTTASVGGEAPVPYALRVTLIFRREGSEWKEVHRHADPTPGVHPALQQLGRLKETTEGPN